RFGGAGVIHATAGGQTADATIRIEIDQTVFGTGTPTSASGLFMNPMTDPTRAPNLLYPLDHAVMPVNVAPAELQWVNSAPGDIFRIKMTKPSVHITAYIMNTGAGFNDSWVVELEAWRRLAQGDPDADSVITVDRWELASNQAIASGAPVHLRFANAS